MGGGGDSISNSYSDEESVIQSCSAVPCAQASPPPFSHGLEDVEIVNDDDDDDNAIEREFCNFPYQVQSEIDVEKRRVQNVQNEVLRIYKDLRTRSKNLEQAKNRILSYTPGAWIEKPTGAVLAEYNIPTTTTLLLVGPKGSGKSSLLNRISKVFDSDKFAPDRAQVFYMPLSCDGTYFLQEFAIPRNSTSFCLYDTRSLTDCSSDNDRILECWMDKGVRHGELVVSKSDDPSLRRRLQLKARQGGCMSTKFRRVNFVIFVVNGVSILKSMGNDRAAVDENYTQLVAKAFSNPYLSFKDCKPVVVFTHGDLLCIPDRIRVQIYLAELLGIPPGKQIFDIPGTETNDAATDLAIVDMLRYSLEHADKNLPRKDVTVKYSLTKKVAYACVILIIALWIASTITKKRGHHQGLKHHPSQPNVRVKWHEIRHIW